MPKKLRNPNLKTISDVIDIYMRVNDASMKKIASCFTKGATKGGTTFGRDTYEKIVRGIRLSSSSPLGYVLNDQHQSRISVKNKENVIDILCGDDVLYKSFTDFEDLYEYVRKRILPCKGLGNLFVYDIALRIGCYLGIEPVKYVYVHRAPLMVAKRLARKGLLPPLTPGQYRIDVKYFAKIFPGLTSSQIENIMCIYDIDLLAII